MGEKTLKPAVEDLLAHRGRMKLISEVLEFDTQRAVTLSIASPKWPLVTGDSVSPLILVELVAQTAGICNGWQLKQKHGNGANARGWLVGIKTAQFTLTQIPLGSVIITTAENTFEYEGFREITGSAAIEEKSAASVILQVVQAQA